MKMPCIIIVYVTALISDGCSSGDGSSRKMARTGEVENLPEMKEETWMPAADDVLIGRTVNHSNPMTEIVNTALDLTGKHYDKVTRCLDKNSETTVSNYTLDVMKGSPDEDTERNNRYQAIREESAPSEEIKQHLSTILSVTDKEQNQYEGLLESRHLLRDKTSNSSHKRIDNESRETENEVSMVGENHRLGFVKEDANEVTFSSTSVSKNLYRHDNRILPFDEDNGDLEPRIVGGEDASIIDFPFMTSLRREWCCHHCGAVLVSSSWLLTAGHCLLTPTGAGLVLSEPEAWFIVAGASVVSDNRTLQCDKGLELRDVVQMLLHPHFQLKWLLHDLGMIRVEPAFRLRKGILPARLPSTEMIPEEDFNTGTICTVVGWGHVSPIQEEEVVLRGIDRRSWSSCDVDGRSFLLPHLQKVNLPLLYYKECIKIYYNWVGGITERASLCTLSDDEKGACLGDSGGPLICSKRTVGIVSWGGGQCGRERKPGVYARIDPYVGWIQRMLLSKRTLRAGSAHRPSAAVKLVALTLVASITHL